MRWLNIGSICCLIAIFLGCGGIGSAYEKRLVGNLGLAAVDTQKQMSVVEFNASGSGYETLVPYMVFAVGWDESHIIAKRRPSDSSVKVDKPITQYYIITLSDRKVHGPFDKTEYRSQRKALKVAESLDFTLKFKDLD
jgi:hypothetical protein